MTTPRLILQFPQVKPKPIKVVWVEKFPKPVIRIIEEIKLEKQDNEKRIRNC
jgi:hypothetical protein